MFAVSFWGYAMGKNLVYAATSGDKNRVLGLGELAAAGAFSAFPMALVAAPVERVKVVLQVRSHFKDGSDGSSRKFHADQSPCSIHPD